MDERSTDSPARDASVVDRAIRLFEFLKRVQQVKSTPVRTIDNYEREGGVLWLNRLPADSAIRSSHRVGGTDSAAPVISIERVRHEAPPKPPETLSPWLDGGIEDPNQIPSLLDSRTVFMEVGGESLVESEGAEAVQLLLDDYPEITNQYEEWWMDWSVWAEEELRLRPIRDIYAELFSMFIASSSHPEDLELVAAVGCLAWHAPGHQPVLRHVLVASVTVELDDATGRLSVLPVESGDTLRLELDMLESDLIQDPQRLLAIGAESSALDAHPMDRDEVSLLGRRLVHTLDPDGQYLDEDVAPSQTDHPIVAFAPAIILRKRSKLGLIRVFDSIVNQIKRNGEVPQGLMPLVDPDHVPNPGQSWDGTDGAIVDVDDEVFLPLPVNERQLQILRRVDRTAQTLVQGPPGTGKTHTAAALISHLLAQGKRVLVTAQTDRALKEVREKLPEAIKPLSVAVVGTGREDMADLRVAVERIAEAANEHDPAVANREIEQHLEDIDRLRRERAGLNHRLLDARESEVRTYELPGITGTLAAIALNFEEQRAVHGWFETVGNARTGSNPPLSNSEILEWRAFLVDESIELDEHEAKQALPDLSGFIQPEDFADLVALEAEALANVAEFADVSCEPAYEALQNTSIEKLENLRSDLVELADEITALNRRQDQWSDVAVEEIRALQATPWRARRDQIVELVNVVRPLVEQLGPVDRIRCSEDPGPLVAIARALRAHLAGGLKLKVDAIGRPRAGALSPQIVKESRPLFEAVIVDSVAPTTIAQLDLFLNWVKTRDTLDALDRAWPNSVSVPQEDTLGERLAWHETELEALQKVVAVATQLDHVNASFATLSVRNVDWRSDATIDQLLRIVEAIEATHRLDESRVPLDVLARNIASTARLRHAAPCTTALRNAIVNRDSALYGQMVDRISHLLRIRSLVERRDLLNARLEASAPNFARLIRSAPSDEKWSSWLVSFEQAWAWSAIGAWVKDRERLDVNQVQRQIDAAEDAIRTHVEKLSAMRAWNYAVSSDRMTGRARANLQQYVSLVQKLGKGTSTKYGNIRRSEIREAMQRCRPSVPVWILPIYRIAEQIQIEPNIFDVIIVDEASQAGTESTFLQYLAPKIVVIGDDKQVSPAAVGVDQQELRDLANQYLYDDPYKASWQEPTRSLFDEAKMRFDGMITLIEHRRCVPEIIGFSNRVAYEPDGIRLIPVRQYGADRLDPIRPVFVEDGFMKGGGQSRVNPVEVDAIVDQIEKCFADPTYDGMTFGVISLQGKPQAQLIEKALLERIPPEEWASRNLRCGDSADFQGSERNVIFLSMVSAPDPDRRTNARTTEMFLQRYNVAASRAEDQMWLYHSMSLSDLPNTEDLRFQLIDYCYAVVNRSTESNSTFANPVPEDIRIPPFDSLFEQRVFNRLIDRGYQVVPQFEVEKYRIDLVIIGSKTKVAIECDGDFWHGPDRYQADLARKRDLERNGWKFFNIRESEFYIDRAAALSPLWEMLKEAEVHPSGWLSPVAGRDKGQSFDPVHASPTPKFEFNPPRFESSDSGPLLNELRDNVGLYLQSVPVPSIDDAGTKLVDSSEHAVAAEPDEALDVPLTQSRADVSPNPNTYLLKLASGEASLRLTEYSEFGKETTTTSSATHTRLLEEVLSIISTEGPVLGSRIFSVHTRCSGGQRVGRMIAETLEEILVNAIGRGLVIDDDPLGEGSRQLQTYRLPEQPEVKQRTLGPRTLEIVPPRELAALMEAVRRRQKSIEREALFREVLNRYELKRLTPKTMQRLNIVKTKLLP
ncbi:MAG: AAA family ATPase [Acidimicrobiaceae bacterium]|nr:AAA family ATPase [Acidimicrobiaceae bacterium]